MPKIPVLGKDQVLPSLIAGFHVKIILLLNGINAHRAEHTVREYSVYFDYLLCFIWSLLRCCLPSVSNEMAHSILCAISLDTLYMYTVCRHLLTGVGGGVKKTPRIYTNWTNHL
jgi:hypothetical protein